jgi:tetratricopeptide (TPR) repeat protein
MNETRYKAFISYSHVDSKWAIWLQRSLETYRPPKHVLGQGTDSGSVARPLVPIFRDRSELATAADLGSVINKVLEQSAYQLVICSPEAARSRWVNEEILVFKRLGREDRIFCLIVAGEPNADERPELGLEECLPKALRYRIGADGELSDSRAEPIAADVRDGGDGKADAKLKIIAGMLGVGFDALKQRDMHRSHRRMAAITSAATLGVVITSGLAAYAFWARGEAEQQREVAGFHQMQAENLVGFMVGDMRDRLEPIGRLDILDAIGDEMMAYFSIEPSSAADENKALRQALALRQIGEIRVQQGRIADGLDAFEQAMSLLDGSLLRNVDHEELLFEISQLHFWIADALMRQSDFDSAEQRIQSYLELSEHLYDLHPENPDYKMEVAWAYNNLGTLAHRSGDTERAEPMFDRTLELQQSLVTDYPENLGYQAELANTISWLGSIESARGSLRSSLELYRQELELRQAVSSQSDDPRQSLLLASAYRWIGWTLSAMGQADAALAPHLEAQSLFQELVRHDPDNFAWAQEYYWVQIQLAKDQIRLGLLDEAHRNLEIVERGMARFDDDGRDVGVPRLKSALMSGLARHHLAADNREQAIVQARRALDQVAPHARVADDDRVLIAYAEAAYLVSESTDSGDAAREALVLLGQRADESPELRSIKILLAFNAGDESGASEYRHVLTDSDFAAPFVPGTEVEQWLNSSATP